MAADASEAKDADIGKKVMDLLIFLLCCGVRRVRG